MGSKRVNSKVARVFGVSSLALMAMGVTPAAADFDDALRAYATEANGQVDQAKVAEALDLWHKYAVAGDILSRQLLGDVYSNQPVFQTDENGKATRLTLPQDTGIIAEDKIKALAWYTIAATHDFEDFSQQPDFRQINARVRAQTRIPALKATMTTTQVDRAHEEVITILGSQSEFDLYRLGLMYQSGNGLPKNNVEALKYYNLALSRARNANQYAAERKNFLLTIMTKEEVEEANELTRSWQPPLPEALQGPSPRSIELEEQNRILRERQLALAIEEIEREFTSANDHVIQNALAALGLYLDEIDGEMGPKTRKAVERFQFILVEEDENLTAEEKRNVMTGKLSPVQKVALIAQAAQVNHAQSQYIYGVMHAEGIGVPVDGDEAVRWLKRSASFGYPLAHYALGKYYRSGIYGDNPVAPSRADASFHLGQAAALGYDPAQKELNELYEFNFAND